MNTMQRNYLLILALLTLMIGCSDEAETFLKRDTDIMNFSYLGTTKQLSVFTNSEWEVSSEDNWITLNPSSGLGNGEDRTFVDITLSQNTGDARTGKIILSNNDKQLEVTIVQDEGHFYISENEGEKPYIDGRLILDEDLEAFVSIPYFKASDKDYVNASFTITGPGASGLAITDENDYFLKTGEGVMLFKINGKPEKLGEVIINAVLGVPTRNKVIEVTIKGRVRHPDDTGLEPIESPTLNIYKLLPRLAVMDWGKYTRGSNYPRKYTFELAKSKDGPAIRHYSQTNDWLSTASSGSLTAMFFENNRFVLAALEPGTTYWFRIILHSNRPNEFLDSDVSYISFTTPEEKPLADNILLYKDFDDFWWGGSPIYQAYGVMPIEAQIKVDLDPTSDIVKATDYRVWHPVGNIATPFGAVLGPDNCPTMWNKLWDGEKYGKFFDDNYKGWFGQNVFPNSGCVRIAPATNDGYLRTPKLENISDGTAKIKVTVHTAPYFEPYQSWGEDFLDHLIIVEGPGQIVDGGNTVVTIDSEKQVAVRCESNVDKSTNTPIQDYVKTTEHVIKVTGATKDTQITIKPYKWVSGSSDHYRIWLDDIKIERIN